MHRSKQIDDDVYVDQETHPRLAKEFTAVLTGAGISRDPPSNLPDAATLALEVWGALRDSLPNVIDSVLEAKVRSRLGDVRMEQFLELLTKKGTIPTEIIVDVYQRVGGVAFNENHLRLAALQTKHFTVNMDTLIEDAGKDVNVTHLHGRWDDPTSIRTTVAQYSRGLDNQMRSEFCDAMRDSTVLVIGYSGRDTDVMPIIEENPPKRLVWVGPDMSTWEYEVVALQKRYDRGDFGQDYFFEPREQTAGEYLPLLIPNVPTPTGYTVPRRPPRLQERLQKETETSQRIVAVGRLLFDLGLDSEVKDLLEQQRFQGPLEIARRKILARSLARREEPDAALKLLHQRPSRLSEFGPWLRNATEIDSISRRTLERRLMRWFWRAVLNVISVAPGRSYRRAQKLAQVRRAKRLAVAGKTEKAVAMFTHATRDDRARQVLTDDLIVDSLTWEADALKTIGELNRALEPARRADRLSFYANPSQAAYAKWKLGEILAAAGPTDGEDLSTHTNAILRQFESAIGLAKRVDNRDTLSWILGTCAEVIASADLIAARQFLSEAERLGALAPKRSVHGRTYHLLQCGAVEMIAGDLTTAQNFIDEALKVEQRRVPGARLQAQQLQGEVRWRFDPSYDLAKSLTELAKDYHRLGLRLNEARVQLASATLRGDPIPAWIIDEAVVKGWHVLLRRARGSEGEYPWRWDVLL